jgi:hypothetical protein
MSKTFSDYMMDYLLCDEKNRDPRNVVIADKLKVKDFIDSYIGKNELFDHRIWSGYSVKEALKNIKTPCVVKANNAWHRLSILRNESNVNDELTKLLEYYMTNTRSSWEWYYHQIKPGLIIEKLMPDHHTMHRVYVFGGKAFMFFNQRFDISKNSLHHVPDNTFYYANGELIPVSWDHTKYLHREFDHETLCYWAEKIAAFPDGTPPFVRVDFYDIDDKIYFSEMTFSPDAASRHRFDPDDLDYELGRQYEIALGL